ncbi:MAG: DUF6492 family protein [Chitinispirillales bacterium]|nr:DUF6492 family protein [Chitinispirillales bacterium]
MEVEQKHTTPHAKKLAIVTMSYRDDFEECGLLVKSIDIFVGNEILHYIVVNDEDFRLFQAYNYGQHRILKKSTILPKYLVRLPFKIFGHNFWISPFTIPVRGWIVQQICKLGIFEVINKDIDAVLNVDSESVFCRPFDINSFLSNGKFPLFMINSNEYHHDHYVKSTKRLLRIDKDITVALQYSYIVGGGECFTRKNLTSLLKRIGAKQIFRSWKMRLCNTYRFSEYNLYGIYVNTFLDEEDHYLAHIVHNKDRPFPLINIMTSSTDFENKIKEFMSNGKALGLWMQKHKRNKKTGGYLSFGKRKEIIQKFGNFINREQ